MLKEEYSGYTRPTPKGTGRTGKRRSQAHQNNQQQAQWRLLTGVQRTRLLVRLLRGRQYEKIKALRTRQGKHEQEPAKTIGLRQRTRLMLRMLGGPTIMMQSQSVRYSKSQTASIPALRPHLATPDANETRLGGTLVWEPQRVQDPTLLRDYLSFCRHVGHACPMLCSQSFVSAGRCKHTQVTCPHDATYAAMLHLSANNYSIATALENHHQIKQFTTCSCALWKSEDRSFMENLVVNKGKNLGFISREIGHVTTQQVSERYYSRKATCFD